MQQIPPREFEDLLAYLRRTRGIDFTTYKYPSLLRRFRRRLQHLGIETFSDYQDYLEVHADEFAQLFNTVLINVTGFFRDTATWDYVKAEIIPRIVESKLPDAPIRVWSAGVASGQEAYSIAMLLNEALGAEAFRERVKIYATDVDEDALNQARLATYTESEVQGVSPDLLEKYFVPSNGKYVFRKDLRRAIIFGRHDLVQDAPISKIDLLISRNTLMYFNADTQTRILNNFHFALSEAGILVLGKSETMLTRGHLFVPVDLRRRVFRKNAWRPDLRDRLLSFGNGSVHVDDEDDRSTQTRLLASSLDLAPIAIIIVDAAGRVAATSQQIRTMFDISAHDIGQPLQDLEISYRPVELRSLIERAILERVPITVHDIAFKTRAETDGFLDVVVTPVVGQTGGAIGASAVFFDVTRQRRLREDLLRSKQELETAYEELQSTNEELETTNEELHSTNEELETTNEELQSSNEELETINEELQSTNEEFERTNEEFRRRTEELNGLNTFFEAIMASLRVGVIVLDSECRVQVWNGCSEDLWGFRGEEVRDRDFLSLDFGLAVDQLEQPIHRVLNGESDHLVLRLPATNRRGKSFDPEVEISPLRESATGKIEGVVLLMGEHNLLATVPRESRG